MRAVQSIMMKMMKKIQKYNITSIQNAGGYAIILRPQNEQLLWDVISEINQRATKDS